MLDANRFDLWKKDGLFSAAEQVQESADTYVFQFSFDLGFFRRCLIDLLWNFLGFWKWLCEFGIVCV